MAVLQLPKLHARFRDAVRREGISNWAITTQDEGYFRLTTQAFKGAVPKFLAKYKRYLGDQSWFQLEPVHEMITWLKNGGVDKLNDLAYWPAELGGQQHTTFMHGDFRFDNFFFPKNEGGEVLVFDFQLSREFFGEFDLAWFLFQSNGPKSTQVENDVALIKLYHEALVALPGCEAYTLEECTLMFTVCLSYVGMYMVLGHETLDRAAQLGERSMKLVRGSFESMLFLWKRWDALAVTKGFVEFGLERRKRALGELGDGKLGGPLSVAEAREVFERLVPQEMRGRLGLIAL